MTVLRKLRGVVGTAALWGAAWLPLGVILGIYRAFTLDMDVPMSPGFWIKLVGTFALVWTVWGAASGASFALALTLAGQDRSLTELSFRRFAVLGAIGAVTPSATFLLVLWLQTRFADLLLPAAFVLSLSGVLGAASAVGTFALARRSLGSVHERGGLTSA